ncbi:MAG TPA: prenyltransferase/squalene oxidase repeat-containing protein [Lacipirellulaceae bacterium]|jgi:squalene-hopene/tetraprenyl-beta-curcumene cyclase|nr:prenyltransferase/squalene oxidase repeat-containing protein [Lacipirellulaceae bacterium]
MWPLKRQFCVILICAVAVGNIRAAEPELKDIVSRGFDYLAKAQNDKGQISPRIGSGVTSLAVTAALRNGRKLDDPLVAKGFKALEAYVHPDGGIYGSDRVRNYETCVAIMCLAEANKIAGDKRYDKILKNAGDYVRGLQIGADGGVDKSDPKFGGVGYSGPERPDLSNTAYLVDALHSMGATDDDPAIQRALVFVSRCQNLKGKWNDTKFGPLVDDGGFYYVIPTANADPRDSDQYTANGGLRSSGSMTYSGFKSLIYAGLKKDDPRTAAAAKWIGANYSVTDNPGQGNAGLFYYYQLFGSALAASGMEKVATKSGEKDWKHDLIVELAKTQKPDGSWANSNRQFMENDPSLCTAFALLALSNCDDKPTGK